MTVYLEYAFAENALLDGALLYLSARCAHAETGKLRLAAAAAVGGGEALLIPLLPLPTWCLYPVKLLGGLLLVLIAVKGTRKTLLFASGAFFALTFALGGLLVAVYSFCGVPYLEEGGYFVESAPVGLVLGAGGCLLLLGRAAAARLYRYIGLRRSLFPCRLCAGGKTCRCRGLADSGNALFFRGKPVCMVSALTALALFGGAPPVGRMRYSTAAGSRDSPVFACERLSVADKTYENVYFTVGDVPRGEYAVILHTAYIGGVS